MPLNATIPRLALVAITALVLFVAAFLVARGGSSEAAPPGAREQPMAAPAPLEHAPLRPIGAVPALPPAARKPARRRSSPPPPPAASRPRRRPVAPPPPPPPPPPCVGEIC